MAYRALLAVAAAVSGCAAPGTPAPTTAPAPRQEAGQFAPLPTPPDFDLQRASLGLAQIPDDPPAPSAAEAVPPAELPRQALRRLEEARRLFAEQRYTEAIAQLDDALRYNAKQGEAHRMIALACMLSGSDERARSAAEQALRLQPDDQACHYVLARLADKEGKPQEALRRYRLSLKCPPPAAERGWRVLTHYYLGLLLDGERYLAAAIEQLEAFEAGLRTLGPKEIDDNPELSAIVRVQRASVAMRVGRAYGLLGRYAQAADALKLAVAQSPKDEDLRTEYIRMLVRARRTDQASEEAARFVSDSGGSREAVGLLLAVHRFVGTPQRGVDIMKEIVGRQPDNLDLWSLYAEALVGAGQREAAVKTLTDLLARHPEATEGRWKLIELERLGKNWPAWLERLAEALAARPDDDALATRELERVEAATAEQIAAEAARPAGGPGTLLPPRPQDKLVAAALDCLLGQLCDRCNLVEDARRFFERSVELRPGFLPASIGAAGVYVRRCQWAAAIKVAEAARAAGGKPAPQLERLLGRCFDGLDVIDQAVSHYEQAIQLDRRDTTSMMLLGRLYDRVGRRREAQRQYEQLLAVDPDDMEVREALIHSLLHSPDIRSAGRRTLSELADMQRRAPQHPATQRCSALMHYLSSPDQNAQAYLEQLRRLVETHPEDQKSREELAARLIEMGEFQAARTELAAALERDPRSAIANPLMSIVLKRLLLLDEARQRSAYMLGLYPNRPHWLAGYADLLTILQDYDGAIGMWGRLLVLEKDAKRRTTCRIKLMETYRLAGRFEEARQRAEEWLEEPGLNDPSRDLIRWFLLAADVGAKDYDRYLGRCREWLEKDRKNALVREWLVGTEDSSGITLTGVDLSLGVFDSLREVSGAFAGRGGLIGAKRCDEAVQLALEWLAEEPKDDAATDRLIEVLQASRRYAEAAELARGQLAAASTIEQRLQARNALREIYVQARQYDEAIAIVGELIAETAKYRPRAVAPAQLDVVERYIFEYRELLGRILTQARRFDEAVDHYNRMILETDERTEQAETEAEKASLRRQKAGLLRLTSYTYQRQERMDLAEQRLREAYQLSPTDVGVNNDLGYTLADAGKELEEAERMIRVAAGAMPHMPAYLDSLGWVRYKKGNMPGARAWLMRAAAYPEGNDPVIWDHLGDVCWRLGQREEAVRSWQRSRERHEEQVADGDAEADDPVIPRVRAKIEVVNRGGEPLVAPVAEPEAPASCPAAS